MDYSEDIQSDREGFFFNLYASIWNELNQICYVKLPGKPNGIWTLLPGTAMQLETKLCHKADYPKKVVLSTLLKLARVTELCSQSEYMIEMEKEQWSPKYQGF